MRRIKILDEKVVAKIAAGEVIERPASVVKELIENSLDAGASRIIVEVEDGGKKLIRVSDDGCGILKDDVPVAFERHSTSKISTEKDLERIKTLGFRGEALPSIAEVARVICTTRAEGEEKGTKYIIDCEKPVDLEDVGRDVGTTVEVRDIFYSVPARRKFLKSSNVEFTHILNVFVREALAHPSKAFILRHNGRDIMNLPPARDLKQRVSSALGSHIARGMTPIRGIYPLPTTEYEDYEAGKLEIYGLISRPSLKRGKGDYIFTYVNGRYVISQELRKEIMEAYSRFIEKGRYPICVIFIKIDESMVDVNVHPSKIEVKFANEGFVLSYLISTINSALTSPETVPRVDTISKIKEKKVKVMEKRQKVVEDFGVVAGTGIKKDGRPVEKGVIDARIIGQIKNLYIIMEGDEGIVIVDQHAAHERINYERLKKDLERGGVPKQRVIGGKILNLSQRDYSLALSNSEILKRMGYEFEIFGGKSIRMLSVPVIRGKVMPPESLIDILEDLPSKSKRMDEIEDNIIKSMACHGSVKAGDELSDEEMVRIIREMRNLEDPHHCPHGRPTMVHIPFKEIRKKFGRA